MMPGKCFRAAKYDETDPYSKSVPAPGLGSAQPVLTIGVPSRADLEFFGDTMMEAA
ncbi:hypothetical protein GGE12_001348 [Rhizobium mongolense]|uniref:Uncharacterized protein n=1 Tax=Rhizobium mongolense TaxID=57676 RepID=A0A7W6RJH8_9HYPH|nr:hypothetical protein [Rhizobium mongolense]